MEDAAAKEFEEGIRDAANLDELAAIEGMLASVQLPLSLLEMLGERRKALQAVASATVESTPPPCRSGFNGPS